MTGLYSPFDNLGRLWKESDCLISWAKEMFLEEAHLEGHLELVETYMGCVFTLQKNTPKADDRCYALSGLFLRTFDNFGHAVRASLSGNYSGSAMYGRDLLETCFLLSYLMDHKQRPIDWLKSNQEEIRKKYSPVTIRRYLDERDGFKERKREKHYKILSTLGAHPTPFSFKLKKDGAKSLHTGPFKQVELLKETIEELAKIALLLAGILIEYQDSLRGGEFDTSRLSLVLQKNRERYFSA